MRLILITLSCSLVAGCGEPGKGSGASATDSTQTPVVVNAASNIPLYRDTVSKKAVAEYRVKTDNPLNDWYFSVRLFETKKTFHYVIKLQFEEVSRAPTR